MVKFFISGLIFMIVSFVILQYVSFIDIIYAYMVIYTIVGLLIIFFLPNESWQRIMMFCIGSIFPIYFVWALEKLHSRGTTVVLIMTGVSLIPLVIKAIVSVIRKNN